MKEIIVITVYTYFFNEEDRNEKKWRNKNKPGSIGNDS